MASKNDVLEIANLVIDGSNAAHACRASKRPKLADLIAVRDAAMAQFGVAASSIRVFLDAPTRCRFSRSDRRRLEEMLVAGEVLLCPAGVPADSILLREAKRLGAAVISNDTFRDHRRDRVDVPLIRFMLIDTFVHFADFILLHAGSKGEADRLPIVREPASPAVPIADAPAAEAPARRELPDLDVFVEGVVAEMAAAAEGSVPVTALTQRLRADRPSVRAEIEARLGSKKRPFSRYLRALDSVEWINDPKAPRVAPVQQSLSAFVVATVEAMCAEARGPVELSRIVTRLCAERPGVRAELKAAVGGRHRHFARYLSEHPQLGSALTPTGAWRLFPLPAAVQLDDVRARITQIDPGLRTERVVQKMLADAGVFEPARALLERLARG